MGKYGSGNWGVMTPNAARYYATSAVNMAVMFSSGIFRDSLMNYKGSIHNDAGKEIDREGLLKSILNKQSLVFGVVTGPESPDLAEETHWDCVRNIFRASFTRTG